MNLGRSDDGRSFSCPDAGRDLLYYSRKGHGLACAIVRSGTMNKYHIGNLHIESCEQLNGTGLLLGKSSKIAPGRKSVESAYFIVSGKGLTPLPGGMPEIICAQGNDYVFAYDAKPGTRRIRSSFGKEIEIKRGDPYLPADGKIEISTQGRVLSYDVRLNKIGESDRFGCPSPRAFPEFPELTAQGYRPTASTISEGTALYEKDKGDSVLCQRGKERLSFKLKAIKGMGIKRFCFVRGRFYVLYAKEGALQLSAFDENGVLLGETRIKGYEPELRILGQRLVLLYDDHSEWTDEEKASYPEFSLGPTTVAELVSQ